MTDSWNPAIRLMVQAEREHVQQFAPEIMCSCGWRPTTGASANEIGWQTTIHTHTAMLQKLLDANWLQPQEETEVPSGTALGGSEAAICEVCDHGKESHDGNWCWMLDPTSEYGHCGCLMWLPRERATSTS